MSGNNGHFDDGRANGRAEAASLITSALPIGITESDALGFIEGSLDPADAERVASTLGASPAARGLLYAMRSDRDGVRDLSRLTSSASEDPPAGLVDGALARARMTITPEKPTPVTIAVARPVRLRTGIPNRFALPLPAVLSLAAFVAVSSVAAIVFIALQNPATPRGGPIARGTGDDRGNSESHAHAPQQPEESRPAGPAETTTTDQDAFTLADTRPEQPPAISLDEAFELARAGRLVIRVEAGNPAETASRLSRPTGDQRRFALERERNASLSATLAAMFPNRAPISVLEDPTALAAHAELPPPAVDLGTIEQYQPVALRANIVASREAFESLVLWLRATENATVVFEPVETPIVLGPVLPRAEEVFWWRSSPEQWAGWTQIPAIVHRSDR